MGKTAFLFPGQGSQVVGMGKDLFDEFSYVRELFEMADEITKLPISKLCFEGPMPELTLTVNLQPAVTLVNLACLAALEKEGRKSDISAGHSLGEFSALASAQVISPEDALRLVFRRGSLMHREATRHLGAMAAIMGLSIEAVREVTALAQEAGVVCVANHNSEQQIVISGEPAAVAKAGALASEKGGRAIPLKVSGAWHSTLIQGAEEEFAAALAETPFRKPVTPVIHNVTAGPCEDPEEIKGLMVRQLCSPVRWFDSVQVLVQEGVTTFVEVGPGKVLAGLLKKILPAESPVRVYNVYDLATYEAFLKAVI